MARFLLLSCFYLEPGDRPRSMQLCFVALQLAKQTQLEGGWVPAPAALTRVE